jgi:paraquat-inducible protein B
MDEEMDAAETTGRRVSFIWAIPVVAILVAGFLGWKSYSERGPEIVVTFSDADGLQAGTTQLKFKNVELGLVDRIALAPDNRSVEVHIAMQAGTEAFLTDKARFWVVRPRLTGAGISGLDTLVSGAYLAVDPGEGGSVATRRFAGLEDPPVVRSDVAGTRFVLKARRIGSLGAGSPVFFRDFEVGQVLAVDHTDMAENVTLHVFVQAPYDSYVRASSRFWNASGLKVTMGADGLDVEVESLQALLSGGIVFDTPRSALREAAAKEDTVFRLYKNQEEALSARYATRLPYLTYLSGTSVRGLAAGSPVELQGIRIGTVTEVDLRFDAKANRFVLPVRFELEPERIGMEADAANDVAKRFARTQAMVSRGLRVQVVSTNLLTGQLALGVVFDPDAAPAEATLEGEDIVVPSVPPALDGLTSSAGTILSKLAALPWEELAANLNGTLAGTNALANGPELKATLAELASTASEVRELARQANAGLGPALGKAPEIAASLEATLANSARMLSSVSGGYGADSQFKRDVDRLVEQLTDMARSVRGLAELLNERPEALIQGNAGTAVGP